ncbi:MAG: membrane protein insertase YidC, partial [Candidatus Methylomirabilales bacterium]
MTQLPDPDRGDMERRAIVAAALAVIVLLAYQAFFTPAPPPTEPKTEPRKEAAEEKPAVKTAAPQHQARSPRLVGAPRRGEREEAITLETDLLKVVLTNRGGGIRSWQLKQYQEESGLVDLVGMLPDRSTPIPLAVWVEGGEGRQGLYRVVERPAPDPTKPQRVVVEFQEASGIVLEKTLVLYPGRYLADVEIRLQNPGSVPHQGTLRLEWGPSIRLGAADQEVGSVSVVARIDGKIITPPLEKSDQETVQSGTVSWTAIQDRYFTAAFIPAEPGPSGVAGKDAEGRPIVGLVYPMMKIPPGGETRVTLELFAGPKEIARLREAGHDLQKLVDLGWFDFLARPALYFLRFIHDFTGNYGVAIIIITILQKVGFYPLAQKSHKSMHAMQALQPKIQAIKERYKNNPQKVNQETMELYKRHGVNPLGGCLPMVIQIPIFIALYNALASSVELWRAPFALWIDDLSVADTLFVVPFPIPYIGDAFAVRGLPVIMGISMFIQQKMSPMGGDPRQAQMMLYLMPVMFTFIFWGMPSGLVLYWLVNNVLQIGHQYRMNRGLGLSVG